MATKSELARTKELAIVILEAQAIDHDKWLQEQYQKVIDQNTKLLVASVKANQKAEQQNENLANHTHEASHGGQMNGGASRG